MRTRFAPSPTGDLHLGGAWTALASWWLARSRGGAAVLRLEDLDPPRVVRGSTDRILEDLAWLGLEWDEGPREGGPFAPYVQSERAARYEAAIATLNAQGLVYACDCSRKEIAEVASAPHADRDASAEHRYPGTCRDAPADREMKRPPALRVRVPEGAHVTFEDGARGVVSQDVYTYMGDFVLKRADGVYAYQLAVAVDDATMEITDVVRGRDLLLSTPRQLWLMRRLELREPRYVHVPLVTAPDGARLAKRTPHSTIRELMEAGVRADAIVGKLAYGLGISASTEPRSPSELVRATTGRDVIWRTDDFAMPATFD